VDVLAFDSPEFVVKAVARPILPSLCHGVAGFAALGLDEETARI